MITLAIILWVLGLLMIPAVMVLFDTKNDKLGALGAGIALLLVVSSFSIMLTYTSNQSEQCHRQGGIMVKSQCIDKDAVIELR